MNSISTNYIAVVAMSVNCGTVVLSLVMATTLRIMLVRLNKKLNRGEHVEGAINAGQGISGEAASKGFRFLV
jgi:hypothetical protein